MCCANMTKAKRIAAGVMSLALLLVIALSALFLIVEADHDCAGEDCPICAVMQTCTNVLRRFGAAVITLLAAAASIILFLFATVSGATVFAQASPVSRKIRLYN